MTFRPHHGLAALPAAAIAIGVPFANRVHAYVLGLPFLLFWMLACVLLTSAVMAIVGALDRREDARHEPPGPPAGPGPRA